jgi:hypothetical protein
MLEIPPEDHNLLLRCHFHKFPSCFQQCISIARYTEHRSGQVAKGIVSQTPETLMADFLYLEELNTNKI